MLYRAGSTNGERLYYLRRALSIGLFAVALSSGATTRDLSEDSDVSVDTATVPDASSIEEIRSHLSELAFSEKGVSSAEFSRLDRRFRDVLLQGNALPSDWRMMIQIAMKAWRFDRIQAYRSYVLANEILAEMSVPALVVPPADNKHFFWRLDYSKNELIQSGEQISPDRMVLVVFHPACNPCRRIAIDIFSDPVLERLMDACARWIGTVDASFSTAGYAEWERRYPKASPRFIRDWSSIGAQPTYTTPTVFLVQSGAVTDKMVGWNKDLGKEDLKRFLSRSRLNAPSDCGRTDSSKR
jgi:hypothetical protein